MIKISLRKASTKRLSTAFLLSLFLAACEQGAPQQQAPQGMPAMPVATITLTATNIPISTEAVAQTEGAKAVEVRPRVGGILLKKQFEEGAAIKKGQSMFLIDPVPFEMVSAQAEAQLAHREARVNQTVRESERLAKLLDSQSISQREYDNAVSDQAMANADLQSAKAALREAKLNVSYANVKAPSDGMAGRFVLSEGALVSANTTLLTTIVKTSPIWVRFSLSDHELAQLGGMLNSKTVKGINLILQDGTEYPESGKLNFSASEIDPLLGTQQLRASFKNADKRLVPGQFVRVRITTGTQEGVFLVPQTAVLSGEHGKFVWVVGKNEAGKTVATPAPIKVGSWHGQDWVVLGGLKAGDQVIVNNLIKIRPGAEVAPMQPEANPTTEKAE